MFQELDELDPSNITWTFLSILSKDIFLFKYCLDIPIYFEYRNFPIQILLGHSYLFWVKKISYSNIAWTFLSILGTETFLFGCT